MIKGTKHDDVLTGTDRNDMIVGRQGNDTINGLAGNDRIHGNQDNDTIDAGPGNDRAWGGYGNDSLVGGDGNDILRGRPGDDSLDGGPGNDRLWPGRGTDKQHGGDGDDVLHSLARDKQVDTIDCGPGNDVLWINAKETTIDTWVNCETVKSVDRPRRRRRLLVPLSPQGRLRPEAVMPPAVSAFLNGRAGTCGASSALERRATRCGSRAAATIALRADARIGRSSVVRGTIRRFTHLRDAGRAAHSHPIAAYKPGLFAAAGEGENADVRVCERCGCARGRRPDGLRRILR